MAGTVCPECGTPAAPQGAGCACGGAGGTGPGPAAFEPLRIRPYVNLPQPSDPASPWPAGDAAAGAPDPYGTGAAPAGRDPRAPAWGAPAGGGASAGVPLPPEAAPAHGAWRAEPDVESTAPLYPVAGPPAGGAAPDPGYAAGFAGADDAHGAGGGGGTGGVHGDDGVGGGDGVDVTPEPRRSRRREEARRSSGGRRPGAVAAAVAAVVAVVGTAAFASGLFDADDTADRVAPDPNLSAPPWPSGPAGPTPEESATPSRTASSEPSAATSSASSATTPSPSASSAPASAEATSAAPSAGPTASRLPELRATASVRPRPGEREPSAPDSGRPQEGGSTLSRGDQGEEVLELQHRLRAVGLYDSAMHGRYDKNVERAVARYQAYRGITADPSGVYGPATRETLEAESRDDD
ncbi:hypothetical protein GCM10010249_38360 [Streptomyces roseolilacinus]|uniref:Peptidoglycan binding-like domain-containing protein n=1 Tax=Streptomyces roseolilacinus TaxID=66904 RepID=A0A918EME5_9ACTN|nr:hypothetical protein GCM10010249_38360 [Streptomyces roseolilacinus]